MQQRTDNGALWYAATGEAKVRPGPLWWALVRLSLVMLVLTWAMYAIEYEYTWRYYPAAPPVWARRLALACAGSGLVLSIAAAWLSRWHWRAIALLVSAACVWSGYVLVMVIRLYAFDSR